MVKVKKHSKVILLNLLLILFFWLSAGNLKVKAQQLNEKTAFTLAEISEFVIKEFRGTALNNKIYFRFSILDNKDQTEYTLESSINGETFIEVEKKYGFKSPNKQPLLYCYNINQEDVIAKKYRIKIVSDNGINYSEEIIINPTINTPFVASNN
jgi:hypothetical protein